MENRDREPYFALVKLLGECSEPYSVAAAVMAETLSAAEELQREMGALLDDLVTLARLEGIHVPRAGLDGARRDLERFGTLRQRLELDVLFSADTRRRCGRHAVPLLALRLAQVWHQVEFAADWLESTERLRICVDALLAERLSPRRLERHPRRAHDIGSEAARHRS